MKNGNYGNLFEYIFTFSGDFSDDLSFDDDDDDCDGDGKLVIAEGDDLDIKMEGLGEDGKPEKKPRRKHNRFNGMSEEEVMKRLLPDVITPDLDILIVSISIILPATTHSVRPNHNYIPPPPPPPPCHQMMSVI